MDDAERETCQQATDKNANAPEIAVRPDPAVVALFGDLRMARANLRTHEMDQVSVTAGYEDECLIFNVVGYKRYTSIGGDHGDTAVMIEITLKTVGEFGFHAM